MDDNDEKTKETIQETIVNGGLKVYLYTYGIV